MSLFSKLFHKECDFEKVSFECFLETWKNLYGNHEEAPYFEKNVKEIYENIKLPTRATEGSAGFDFHIPFGIYLKQGDSIVIPTGVRCKLPINRVLEVYPRSGHGFKYGIKLANTCGIIDSDYYYADNEGHICIKLVYEGFVNSLTVNPCSYKTVSGERFLNGHSTEFNGTFNKLILTSGDSFAQGLIKPYFITNSDRKTSKEKRIGGMGSTDKKTEE